MSHTSNRHIRVLIVDDNPSIHEDFVKVLRSGQAATDSGLADLEAKLLGVDPPSPPTVALTPTLDSAYHGDEGVAMVAQAVQAATPYAVAFVDVRMPPGIDGIEAASRMWKADPRLQVVICTAYSDHSWHDVTRLLGDNDRFLVLKKPFDAVEVQQLVQALGKKWQLGLEAEKERDNLELMVAARTKELERVNARLQKEVANRQEVALKLERMATHDALTGLANRLLLHERISSAIARAQRHQTQLGVLLLDLNGFKAINDSYGHAAGDELLRVTADRLRACLRACDTIARIGGDEFVVVVEDVSDLSDLAFVAHRIIERCHQTVNVMGHDVRSEPSIGIVTCPNDASDPETLLKCADLAMYRAKEDCGGSYQFFSQQLLSNSMDRATMREELAQAVDNGELELYYQPLQRLTDGAVSGVEALLRWNHPTRGVVPPMEFIPEAEKSGLIVPIGTWALTAACRQLASWHRAGATGMTVAVNVSAHQLRSPRFVDTVRAAVTESGIPAHTLELEITESAAFEDFSLAREVLATIADMGVRILIDDFGSGYSSLTRLRNLPVHGLKIDRFFVQDIANDPQNAAIVMAVVAMAHSLGIEVVAEGIETAAQLAHLRELKWPNTVKSTCDRVQGYFLGRPAPASEIEKTLLNDTHLSRVA